MAEPAVVPAVDPVVVPKKPYIVCFESPYIDHIEIKKLQEEVQKIEHYTPSISPWTIVMQNIETIQYNTRTAQALNKGFIDESYRPMRQLQFLPAAEKNYEGYGLTQQTKELAFPIVMKDKFRSSAAIEMMSRYYGKYKIGLGTKYIYLVEDAPLVVKYDERKDSVDGLEHSMQLLVIDPDNATKIIIDGELMYHDRKNLGEAFLCPIDRTYTLVPDTHKSICQIMVFPIYGKLDVENQLLKYLTPRGETVDLFREIDSEISALLNAEKLRSSKKIEGLVRMLGNEELNELITMYNGLIEYMSSGHGASIAIQYYDEDDKLLYVTRGHRAEVRAEDKLLTINDGQSCHLVHHIRIVTEHDEHSFLVSLKTTIEDYFTRLKKEDEKEITVQLTNIPSHIFCVILRHQYPLKNTIDGLVKDDASLVENLSKMGRKIIFIPIGMLLMHRMYRFVSMIPYYTYDSTNLFEIKRSDCTPTYDYPLISDLWIDEEDDITCKIVRSLILVI